MLTPGVIYMWISVATCLDTLEVELGDGLVGLPVDPGTCKKTERIPVEKMAVHFQQE